MTDTSVVDVASLSPPGDTISDRLEENGWTQTELAERIGYTEKHVSQLVNGKATINEDTALRLEKVVGGSMRFWLAREANYREALARAAEAEALAAQAAWLDELPLGDMIRFGWIPRRSLAREQVAACLHFFGVASVDVWRERYERPIVAFRRSPQTKVSVGSVAAWLRQGEIEGAILECKDFDKSLLRSLLGHLRSLSLEPDPNRFWPKLTALGATCGVAICAVPAPGGCAASAATCFLKPTKALLLLSLRYKSNDQLWFSVFHEIGHLLLHSKKLLFIEMNQSLDSEHEDEANDFSANTLIPASFTEELRALPNSASAIVEFSRRCGIHEGIVVGRLQREGIVPWRSTLNKLKYFYEWH